IRSVKGPRAAEVSHALHNLAGCLLESGRLGEAKEKYLQAIDIRREHYKREHALVAASTLGLARTELALGNASEAEKLPRESLATPRSNLRDRHPDTGDALEVVAAALIAQDHASAAEPLLQEAIEIARTSGRRGGTDLAEKQSRYGECLAALEKY